MVFCFQSGVSGQIFALMLEASFISKVAELTYTDHEFERLLFRPSSSDAMFRVMTVHGVALLYHTPGTGI